MPDTSNYVSINVIFFVIFQTFHNFFYINIDKYANEIIFK